jgi:uncharacterized protein (DUF1015 family)
MADVLPFCAYRYSINKSEDLFRFVSPPYDMIDDQDILKLYKRDPANVVRIIQNKKEPQDKKNSDRHKRAAKLLDNWIDLGILKKDDVPSFYIYKHEFKIKQGNEEFNFIRTSVICLVKLEDYEKKIIFPHEYTLTGPKIDRYELLSETKTHSELIFGLVPDDSGEFYKKIISCINEPDLGKFTSDDGVTHYLSKISDKSVIQNITNILKEKNILIADGHHRYETALSYYKDMQDSRFSYILMALVSMADPGLKIRAFHRLLNNKIGSLNINFHDDLKKFFNVVEIGFSSFDLVASFLQSNKKSDILFLDSKEKKLYELSLNSNGEKYLKDNSNGKSDLWNKLNVSVINSIIINNILSLPLDPKTLHEIIDYINDAQKVFNLAIKNPQNYPCAFFLHPIDISTVNSIVYNGERMPQKSTNFFPKFYSGLVFYRMGS